MANLDVSLLPWQQEVWEDNARFKVIAAGRRCGKSRLVAYKLLIEALQCTKGWVFYIAPTQSQARDIMWKVLIEIGKDVIESTHINNLHINLINGATIALKGADRPDTMRGVSLAFCAIDEYAQLKPWVWEEILRPALADQQGDAIFIGTPEGRNHFYDLFEYAKSEKDPDWKAWHFTSYDNPLLSSKEIEAAKRSMSSYAFRKEFMASFASQGSDIFKPEWVKIEPEAPKGPLHKGDYYIACDLAGFETLATKNSKASRRLDNSAVAVVHVTDDGQWFVEEIVWGRWDLNETATKIFNLVKKYKPVSVGIEKGIAQQAVMSPLSDLMRKNSRFFRIELCTHGNKKKTDRIVWALQGRFENGVITLKEATWNDEFLDELYQFPSSLVHDDLIDALSYIDQLATIPYWGNEQEKEDLYEPLDLLSGY